MPTPPPVHRPHPAQDSVFIAAMLSVLRMHRQFREERAKEQAAQAQQKAA